MNRKLLTVFRWLVGLLFIFSGLIKANDPLGLSYKMQEFFEAWQWKGFHDYTLQMSLLMNLLEVVAGVALIVGWQMKRVIWLLLLLIVFFTFLTSYVLFSGKIHACGCFGDCVPLTPIQTFAKDVVLLLMIIVLLLNAGKMKPYFSARKSLVIIMVSFVGVIWLQRHVRKHLPILDCLPFAKGKNILEGMKLPPNAVPDSTVITFKYKKNGKEMEFDQAHFPDDFDSTYEFVNRYDKVVRKGTGLPKIVDFSLVTMNGNDTTQALLNSGSKYVMLFVKDFSTLDKWKKDLDIVLVELKQKSIPIYLVTADAETASQQFGDEVNILKCDATVIKTAARVIPTCFLMNGADILNKVSWTNSDKLLK